MADLSAAIAAAREALVSLREHDGGTRYNGDDDDAGERACCLAASWKPHDSDCPHTVAVAEFDRLLAALDAQPKAGEVWQYRASTTSYGKTWVDCCDEQRARAMEANGFEIRCLYAAPNIAPPAQPRVERYADGVLVHWPEGMEQYVQVGDCVTGNLAPPAAVPAGYALVPVEPTEAMLLAGGRSLIDGQERRAGYSWAEEAGMCFAAMLAAANKENNND